LAKTRTKQFEIEDSKALAGVLALLAADREERIESETEKSMTRTEIVLAQAGLAPAEIAHLLSKPEPGVRKAIQRGRAAKKTGRKKRGS
jgi:DNA-directed RNA polymerase specialized sigma24 family protein